jgi:hypothetical protein
MMLKILIDALVIACTISIVRKGNTPDKKKLLLIAFGIAIANAIIPSSYLGSYFGYSEYCSLIPVMILDGLIFLVLKCYDAFTYPQIVITMGVLLVYNLLYQATLMVMNN